MTASIVMIIVFMYPLISFSARAPYRRPESIEHTNPEISHRKSYFCENFTDIENLYDNPTLF